MSDRLPEHLEVSREFDRNSPTLEKDLEVFFAEVARWQRAAGIDGFLRSMREEGDRITVRLMPFSKTPNARLAPPADAFRQIGGTGRKDGFHTEAPAMVSLGTETVSQADVKAPKELEAELKSLLRGRRGGI